MYKGLLTSVRVLQLHELKLSGSMANIVQNNIICDSKKILLTSQNEKYFYFFIICFAKNLKSRVLIQSFTRRQHRTKIHLLAELWTLF